MENKTAITAEQIIDKVNSNLYSEVITNASRSVAIREINEFALQQTDSMEKKTQVLSDIIVIKDDTIERLKEELTQAKSENSKLVELAFNESRLTHPMLGFKHKDFNEFLSNTKEPGKDECEHEWEPYLGATKCTKCKVTTLLK